MTYDSVKGQTLIDVNTATFTKDAVVVIDGQYDLGQIELGSNSHLHLTLNEILTLSVGLTMTITFKGLQVIPFTVWEGMIRLRVAMGMTLLTVVQAMTLFVVAMVTILQFTTGKALILFPFWVW